MIMQNWILFFSIGLVGVFSTPLLHLEKDNNDITDEEEKPGHLNNPVYPENSILESVRESVLHKCTCEGNEILTVNNTCTPSPTKVQVPHPLTYVPILVNTSDFSEILREKLSCKQGFFKVQPEYFFIEPSGSLYYYELEESFKKDDYCIDHILENNGNIHWMAEVCLPAPSLIACCPAGHIISDENKCTPHHNVTFTPSVKYDGHSLPSEHLGEVITEKIICSEGSLYEVDLNEDEAVLFYRPHDYPQLVYFNQFNEQAQVSSYCIGMRTVMGSFQYVGQFCYVDPCVKSTCVHKCCPPEMHLYNGSCVYDEPHNKKLELKFYTKGNVSKVAQEPKHVHSIYGQLVYCTVDRGLNAIQLNPHERSQDAFYLTHNGQLHVPAYEDGAICAIADDTTIGKADFSVNRYCIDMHETDDGRVVPTAIICFQKSQDPGCSPNTYGGSQNYTFLETLSIEERVKTSTIHKCKCGANEILSTNNNCIPHNTKVEVLHPLTLESININTSYFGNVYTREINCDGGFQATPDRFIIQPSGHLYDYKLETNIVLTDYCLEHLSDYQDDGDLKWRAELCLPDPPIPACCPHGHVLAEDGSCANKSVDIELIPPIYYNGVPLADKQLGEVTQEMVNCSDHESMIEIEVDGENAILNYYPYYAPQLHYFTKYMERAEARPYCLGTRIIEGSTKYFSQFCYVDPCVNATCVRKCCPPDMHLHDGGCVQNVAKYEYLDLTFFDAEKLNLKNLWLRVESPDNLHIIYSKRCQGQETVVTLEAQLHSEITFKLLDNGKLHVPYANEDGIHKNRDYTIDRYCLDDSVNDFGEISQIALLCV